MWSWDECLVLHRSTEDSIELENTATDSCWNSCCTCKFNRSISFTLIDFIRKEQKYHSHNKATIKKIIYIGTNLKTWFHLLRLCPVLGPASQLENFLNEGCIWGYAAFFFFSFGIFICVCVWDFNVKRATKVVVQPFKHVKSLPFFWESTSIIIVRDN